MAPVCGSTVSGFTLGSNGIDQTLLPNLLTQGYGAQSAEEKQGLLKLMRNLNFNDESGSEPFSSTAQSSGGIGASNGFCSPEFRGDFGAGLLDLHAMDDTELLTEVPKLVESGIPNRRNQS